MIYALYLIAAIALAVVLVIGWKKWRQTQQQELFQRAVADFSQQKNLSELFLQAANATGKPRGLRWKICELVGQPLFARDKKSGEILGLNGASIGFEAIPGGDMEEVEAVGDIRYVTVVFVYREGKWQADGRAIMNLEPAQALERLGLASN
jgi:hypothetical protein